MLLLLNKAISEFNNADFFSAHDIFEDIWHSTRGHERFFIQGLVQISVGYFHLVCGNLKGARSLLNKGVNKVEGYLPEFLGIRVNCLVDDVKRAIFDIDKFTLERTELRISQLPQIQIIKQEE